MDEVSAGTVLNNISKAQLECPICYTRYIDPKTLTCAHNFCQKCLEEMMKCHPMKKNIICPICREETTLPEAGIGKLHTSFSLINLMETIAEQKRLVKRLQATIKCEECDEEDEAVSYCNACKEFLCEICNKAHMRSTKTKGHHTTSIDHLRSGKASFESNNPFSKKVQKCETHTNQDKIFYCESCFLMICASCTQDHRPNDHTVLNLSQAIDSSKKNIARCVEDVKYRLEKYSDKKELLKRLYSEHSERIKQKHKIITEDTDRKVAELRKEEQKLKDKVTRFCYQRGKQFEEVMAVNNRNEERIKQQLENERKQVQDFDLLEMQKSLLQGLQDALAIGYPTGCVCQNFQDFKGSSDFTNQEIYLLFEKNRSMTDSEKEERMTVGTRVVRRENWRWGDQDGDPPGEGEICRTTSWEEINVYWDEGGRHRYNRHALDLA